MNADVRIESWGWMGRMVSGSLEVSEGILLSSRDCHHTQTKAIEEVSEA